MANLISVPLRSPVRHGLPTTWQGFGRMIETVST
jgi:hypothetical protein